ncbi:MAG: hypothetical protein RIM99_15960 [Cyclobacteriaceae bacterium]
MNSTLGVTTLVLLLACPEAMCQTSTTPGEELTLPEDTLGNEEQYLEVAEFIFKSFEDKKIDHFLSVFQNHGEEAYASNRSVYEFMADGVIPKRGKAVSLHRLSEPMLASDSSVPFRNIIFHMKDGTSGSMSFTLLENNKIDQFSLFVMSSICSKGKNCSLVTKKLK